MLDQVKAKRRKASARPAIHQTPATRARRAWRWACRRRAAEQAASERMVDGKAHRAKSSQNTGAPNDGRTRDTARGNKFAFHTQISGQVTTLLE